MPFEGVPPPSQPDRSMSRAEYEAQHSRGRRKAHEIKHPIPGMGAWLNDMDAQNAKRKEGKRKEEPPG